MRSAAGSGCIVAFLAASLPVPGQAQTSDIVFGGWSWRSRDVGSRPAGLGGAYVAVADSIRTATVNPGGRRPHPEGGAVAGHGANLWARHRAQPAPHRSPPGAPPGPTPAAPGARCRSARPSPARQWSSLRARRA